ncbi:hypothetical protein QTP86_030753, partial [Hemibagrus guttatus]
SVSGIQNLNVSCTHEKICALRYSSVELNCSYPNINIITGFWFSLKDKAKWREEEHPEDLALDSDYTGRVEYTEMTNLGSTLTITDLRERDEGEYRFVLITDKGEKYVSSVGVTLTVTGVFRSCWTVTYPDKRVCALEGSSMEIAGNYVLPSQQSAVEVFWHSSEDFKDLKQKPEFANRVEYVKQDRNLTLKMNQLTKDDSGEYRLRIVYTSNRLSGRPGVVLNVTDLQVRLSHYAVASEERTTVTLGCITSCTLSNSPTYLWYKNGQPVTNKLTKHNKLYLISSEDAGNYSCAVKGREDLRSLEQTVT